MPKAVVLLSGGLDSTTVLAVAQKKGFEIFCLSFQYGQLHKRELLSAQKIAHFYKTDHKIITFNLRKWGKSALTDSSLPIPKGKISSNSIPTTYVPGRNIIFLSFALSYAEALEASAIFIGVNALDYSNYPDCRPEFIKAFQKMATLGTKCGFEKKQAIQLKTPLINLSKKEIIKKAIALKAPLELTWSCYEGKTKPCRNCESCLLRAKGFAEAKILDPLLSKKNKP